MDNPPRMVLGKQSNVIAAFKEINFAVRVVIEYERKNVGRLVLEEWRSFGAGDRSWLQVRAILRGCVPGGIAQIRRPLQRNGVRL